MNDNQCVMRTRIIPAQAYSSLLPVFSLNVHLFGTGTG